jgi:protein tyrosine phosphatase
MCSAGVGRTGTFIALDTLLEQAAVEDTVDIFGTVLNMRKDRASMIQTDVRLIVNNTISC